jgi:DhnA family fructose-bisphosphate aldolase class Ia
MNGIEIRLGRIFSSGNGVIIACDHGEFDGPIPGMVNIKETVSRINPSVDGVLMSPAMLRHAGDYFSRRNSPMPVTRLNWNTVYCFHWNYNDSISTRAFSPREMLAMGGEIALVSLTLKTGKEETDSENVGIFRSLAEEAHGLGIPVIGEYFPARSDTKSPGEMFEETKIGCRIMAELGADMIKAFHTPSFTEVVKGCPVPIFALGAAKLPTQLDALKLAYNEINDGARGVVFGRNAIQVSDPSRFQEALIEVVKRNMKPEKAVKEFGLKD